MDGEPIFGRLLHRWRYSATVFASRPPEPQKGPKITQNKGLSRAVRKYCRAEKKGAKPNKTLASDPESRTFHSVAFATAGQAFWRASVAVSYHRIKNTISRVIFAATDLPDRLNLLYSVGGLFSRCDNIFVQYTLLTGWEMFFTRHCQQKSLNGTLPAALSAVFLLAMAAGVPALADQAEFMSPKRQLAAGVAPRTCGAMPTGCW